MTLNEAMKELSKPIKSALDIIGEAFRKITEQEGGGTKQLAKRQAIKASDRRKDEG